MVTVKELQQSCGFENLRNGPYIKRSLEANWIELNRRKFPNLLTDHCSIDSICIQKHLAENDGKKHTSIVFSLKEEVGSLARALKLFEVNWLTGLLSKNKSLKEINFHFHKRSVQFLYWVDSYLLKFAVKTMKRQTICSDVANRIRKLTNFKKPITKHANFFF